MSLIERGTHDRDYTVIANAALRDPRLSWGARGVLAYLLSKPDDWTVMQAEVVAASPDGERVVRRALDELERHGYLERTMANTANGRRVDSTLREEPNSRNDVWEDSLLGTSYDRDPKPSERQVAKRHVGSQLALIGRDGKANPLLRMQLAKEAEYARNQRHLDALEDEPAAPMPVHLRREARLGRDQA